MSTSEINSKRPVLHIGLVFFVLVYGLIIHRCNSEVENFDKKAKNKQFTLKSSR